MKNIDEKISVWVYIDCINYAKDQLIFFFNKIRKSFFLQIECPFDISLEKPLEFLEFFFYFINFVNILSN